jgi:tetratricopeptide (TPR) repeat protein
MAKLSVGISSLKVVISATILLTAIANSVNALPDRHQIANYSEEITSLSATIQQNPDRVDAYMERAAINYKLDRTLAAIADYTQAIRIDPQLAIAYNNRAIAKLKLRDYRGAYLDYSEVIRLEPEKAITYNNRAVLRHQLGDCRGAIVDLVTAAKLFKQQGNIPDYHRTLANLNHFQKLLKN